MKSTHHKPRRLPLTPAVTFLLVLFSILAGDTVIVCWFAGVWQCLAITIFKVNLLVTLCWYSSIPWGKEKFCIVICGHVANREVHWKLAFFSGQVFMELGCLMANSFLIYRNRWANEKRTMKWDLSCNSIPVCHTSVITAGNSIPELHFISYVIFFSVSFCTLFQLVCFYKFS
jgi:hypothetical protein